jgi:hypothetical protein
MPIRKIIVIISILLSLVGCQKNVIPAKGFPTPESGKATVAGRLFSSTNKKALTGTVVRLAEVYRQNGEGAFLLDAAASPGTVTDQEGYFVFPNVDAKEYVLVVGDPMISYVIVSGSDGQAKVWKTESNKITNVGDIYVNYQQ